MSTTPLTVLCLASYEKGHDFLRELKAAGCRVLLITSLSLREVAQWPLEALDEIFYMPDQNKTWNRDETLMAVAHLARRERIGRIVALDDFDQELAAYLREHLRIGGMGETTARYFRDKLAMRMRAREGGLAVPDFVSLVNDGDIADFARQSALPWVLKPRSLGGAIGIRKIERAEELWPVLEALGDQRLFYLLEQFIEGDVYHVDSIVDEREVRFACVSSYGRPPLEVSHGGGVFTSRVVERGTEIERALLDANGIVLSVLGLVRGVAHTEFIRGAGGRIYFLEIGARVAGAHLAELVEAATGVNLWREWAKIEIAGGDRRYVPPEPRQDYAGLLVSLARQEWPNLDAYNDPEIVWRMNRRHHAGLIVKSADCRQVEELLSQYLDRFQRDFAATLPPADKPTN